MLGQVAMRHILLLVVVLVELVRIDRVSVHCIANKATQVRIDKTTIAKLIAYGGYLHVNAVENVVTVLETVEEIIQLLIRRVLQGGWLETRG